MKVRLKKCDQCLYSKNRIVSASRAREVIRQTEDAQSYFVCHKAQIAGDATVCCRGFFDSKSASKSQMIRIAERLRAIRFVDEKNKVVEVN